ncbi:hypothetical protein [Geomonas agri]|uniref:hypothetical protein n=1 Tax=Geomonas agri TaxID=2873702 RepID=UPI001CD770C1|nr:hypothetical protein [Geomonas agri]
MPHSNLPHPEMLAKSEEMRQIWTPELYAYLLSLLVTPEKYGELHNRFENSVTGFLKGDPEKVKECEEARGNLDKAMSIVQGLGKAVSPIDPTVQHKFGVPPPKAPSAAAELTAAKDLRLFFDKSGQPYCSVSKLAGAKGYDLWFCEGEPSVDSNWKLLTWSSSCQGIYLNGLNRTKTNYLKLRGKRGNEVGPWSNMVILPPV